ncbi:sugar ABC transporter ATP-binding protein [Pantoea sp. App145]|uniref:sugar ABC transporter ATP-binding protein n=1 Tax=Pantoea sp. App145 TaxID=3071567 RepID=UPI003A7FCFC4
MSSLLCIQGVKKRYGDNAVLHGLSLEVAQHNVVSLVGENGAGKTTLFDILSGLTPADGGEMSLRGVRYAPRSLQQAQDAGISRVFQEQALVSGLSVYENLLLGRDRHFYRAGFLQRRAMVLKAQQLADEAVLQLDVRQPVDRLSFSQRQTIEIARACLAPGLLDDIAHPLILLDEPTATLDLADEKWFLDLVGKLRQRASFLLVSHRLQEVIKLSDVIYVLKDGVRVACTESQVTSPTQLQQWMVGRERAADHYYQHLQHPVDDQPLAFTVQNLARAASYHNINLQIRQGEIVGLGGLLNSGKEALAKSVAGVLLPESGEVSLAGAPSQKPRISKLVRQGVGYIPAERLEEGMIAPFSVSWNLSLSSGADRFSHRYGYWYRRLESQVATDFIERLRIRNATPNKLCAQLSGGNQQKVVLARWLFRQPRVLILDNPTRGVDAGAKEEIYRELRQLSAQGVAILLLSDELLELIGLSHRIVILQHGQQVGEISAPANHKPDEQTLVAMMLNVPVSHSDRNLL